MDKNNLENNIAVILKCNKKTYRLAILITRQSVLLLLDKILKNLALLNLQTI